MQTSVNSSWSADFELVQADLDAFGARVLATRAGLRWQLARAARTLVEVVLYGAAGYVATKYFGRFGNWAVVALMALVGIGAVTAAALASGMRKMSRARPGGYVLGLQRIEIDREGIRGAGAGREFRHDWRHVLTVEETRSHVFIFLDTAVAHVIPKRALAGPEHVAELRNAVSALAPGVAWSTEEQPVVPDAVRCTAEENRGAAGAAMHNVVHGLGLAFFQPHPRRLAGDGRQLVIALLSCAGLLVLIDFVTVPPERYFDQQSVMVHGVRLLALIAAFQMAMLAERTPGSVGRALTSFGFGAIAPLVVALVVMAGASADGHEVEGAWRVVALEWLAWVTAIACRAWTCSGSGLMKPLPLAVARVAVIVVLANVVLGHRPLWWHYDDGAYTDASGALDVERTYYAQPALVDAALLRLPRQRPGRRDLYLVGVGGDAGQDIFMKEVRYVGEVMEREFAIGGRSVLLVNNIATVMSAPLANASNLERVLRGIGAQMNPTEDMLLLYLTSHGSREGSFSLDFWPLDINDLSPWRLADILERSGIRWRIVLVSACYSGTFIPRLESPETLVITAADADSTSFGCSDDRDLTEFAEAYFATALPQQKSFTAAFEQARDALGDRERREGQKHSNPQMRVGSAIAPLLRKYEEDLRDSAVAVPPPFNPSSPAPAVPASG